MLKKCKFSQLEATYISAVFATYLLMSEDLDPAGYV